MLLLKYLLVVLGLGLFGSSGALVAYDVYLSSQLRRLLGRRREPTEGESLASVTEEPARPLRPVRWGLAQRLALVSRQRAHFQARAVAVHRAFVDPASVKVIIWYRGA